MDAADDPDPDSDGWPVYPTAAFYGLWPRFAAAEDDAEGADGAARE